MPTTKIDAAGGEVGEDTSPLGPARAAREQDLRQGSFAGEPARIGHREALEEAAGREVMLLGQHLGRHHECPLMAALDAVEQCRQGDDGLAGADVAL